VSHYDVLGVAPSADQAALRRAYLRLARRHHPDRAGGDAARMQAINQAWATLGDPDRRARYDLSLGAPSVAPPAPAASTMRPGYEPDPRYPGAEVFDDEWEDVSGDDRPVRITVVLPRWLRLLPVGAFGAAVGAFGLGAVLVSEPLLAAALMFFVLSVLFFLSAPFIALLAGHRDARRED
jgi:hypothetical protein